jgi:hypothetical protein
MGWMSGSVEFLRNKVKFDGFKNGVLLEAKGAYLWLFKTGRATQKKIIQISRKTPLRAKRC